MKRPKIKVETVKNGYALDVDGKGYMYFNAGELLAGILAHVGMGIKDPMEEKEILEVLFDALLGSKHAEKLAKIRDSILKLESELYEKIERVNNIITRLREYEDMAENLHKRIVKVRNEVREAEAKNEENKKTSKELSKTVDAVITKTNQLKEEIKTARQVLREIKMAEAVEKRKAEEAAKEKEKKSEEKPKKERRVLTAKEVREMT